MDASSRSPQRKTPTEDRIVLLVGTPNSTNNPWKRYPEVGVYIIKKEPIAVQERPIPGGCPDDDAFVPRSGHIPKETPAPKAKHT